MHGCDCCLVVANSLEYYVQYYMTLPQPVSPRVLIEQRKVKGYVYILKIGQLLVNSVIYVGSYVFICDE